MSAKAKLELAGQPLPSGRPQLVLGQVQVLGQEQEQGLGQEVEVVWRHVHHLNLGHRHSV